MGGVEVLTLNAWSELVGTQERDGKTYLKQQAPGQPRNPHSLLERMLFYLYRRHL